MRTTWTGFERNRGTFKKFDSKSAFGELYWLKSQCYILKILSHKEIRRRNLKSRKKLSF